MSNLITMFILEEWNNSKFVKEFLGKEVARIMFLFHFWNNVACAFKACGPLVTVLCLVNSEAKP